MAMPSKMKLAAMHKKNMTVREFVAVSERLGFRKRWAAGILILNMGAIIFEGIGIGIFLPILEFMNSGGETAELATKSEMWTEIIEVFQYLELPLTLGVLLSIAFCSLLIRQAFTYCRLIYLARTQNYFLWATRNLAFNRYMRAGMVYHDTMRTGDFVNEINIELNRGATCISTMIIFTGYIILCAVYAVALFIISPIMTLIAISVILVATACLHTQLQKTRQVGVALTEANQQTSSFLIERLKFVRLVRLARTEDAESIAMRRLTEEQRYQGVALLALKAIVSVLIEPLVVGVAFIILYLAINNFGLGLEKLLIFFLIGIRLLPVVKEAMLSRQSILGSMASVEIVDRRLSELDQAQDRDDGQLEFKALQHGIQFNHVQFNYDGTGATTPALRDINLFIPLGKMTALVGPSGAGKSTLVDLLPRLRDIDSGEIFLDHVAHASFRKSSLRAGIAFAPQDPQVFNVSAKEHIRYGKADATDAEIVEAARLARADAFLSEQPDGYETLLGENGDRLSGGQRQRLDLARALVSQAPILILDEPTSNLDAESEFEFRKALDGIRAKGDVTIILIGHRLSTISNADQIAVLEKGIVTELDTHDTLVERNGWYAKAMAKQGNSSQETLESDRLPLGSP